MGEPREDGLGPEVGPEEVSALADGLLAPARAAQVEARAEASPELARRIERERAAVEALRAAAVDAGGAPASLRARLGPARRPAPRRALVGGLAVAIAALAALAVFLLLPSGSGGPTIAQAVELADRPATDPPPRASAARPALLELDVDGAAFPAWAAEFGWRAVARGEDELSGRTMRTVVYEKGAGRVRYSIVSGEALDAPEGARRTTRDGIALRVFATDGRTVVTWLRDGRTCLLSGEGGVREETLTKLAVWKGGGAVEF